MTLSKMPIKRKRANLTSEEPVTKKKVRIQTPTNHDGPSINHATQLMSLADSLETGSKLANAVLQTRYERITRSVLSLASSSEQPNSDCDDRDVLLTKVAQLVLSAQRGRQIYQLLSPSSSTRRIRAALHLLTALSTCSGGAARRVLTTLRFERGQVPAVALMRSTARTSDVRAAFVTLVLALFVEQEAAVVGSLLAGRRAAPLTLLMTSMAGDRAAVIALVLGSFRSALLQNDNVSKRDKLCVFNARNMSAILQLYSWRGHCLSWRFSKRFHKKRQRQQVSERESEAGTVDPEELASVRRCVHEFLMLLFTSHQHGVAFRDPTLGTSDTRCNVVVFEMMTALSRPWHDPLVVQLITSTLKACPDLIVPYLATFNGQLNLPVSEQHASKSALTEEEWKARMEFVETIISEIDLYRPVESEEVGDAELSADQQSGECEGCEGEHWESCQLSWLELLPVMLSALFPQCVRALLPSLLSISNSTCVQERALVVRVLALCTRRLLSWRRAVREQHVRQELTTELLTLMPSSDDLQLSVCQETLLLHAELAGLYCRLHPSWLRSDSLLARIWSLTGSVPGDVTLLRAQVEQLLAPALSCGYSLSLQDELAPADGQSGDETSLRAYRIISDILTEPEPVPIDNQGGSQAGPPGSDHVLLPRAPTSLSQYVTECYTALRSSPTDMTTLQRYSTDQLSALSVCDSRVAPASWSQYLKLLVQCALGTSDNADCLCLVTHLKALTGHLPCARRLRGETGWASADEVLKWLLAETGLSDRLMHQQPDADTADTLAETVRERLVELLLALVTRCRHGCKSSHAALYLSAYGASLSRCDQLLLQLLGVYEQAEGVGGSCEAHGVSLHQFRPTVWGRSAALDHYTPTGSGGVQHHVAATCGDVLRLLQPERLSLTCRRVPLDLPLSPLVLVPPPTDAVRLYDPRFLLALLLQLARGDRVLELVESGLLPLLVSLLGCRQSSVRVAACTLLAQLHSSLTQSRRRRRYRQLWLIILQLIRAAACSEGDRGGAAVRRLPFVSVYTWSRLLRVLGEPGHRLHALTCRHVLRCSAAGSLHADQVPLFFQLFNSRDVVAHAAHRDWLLESLTHSVRSVRDYTALQRTTGYKLLMGVAGSHAATVVGGASARTRPLALLTASVRVPGILWRLERQHALTVWLCGHVTRLYGSAGSTYRAAVQSLVVALFDSVKQLGSTGVASTPSFLALCTGTQTFLCGLSAGYADSGPFGARLSAMLDEVELLLTTVEKNTGLCYRPMCA